MARTGLRFPGSNDFGTHSGQLYEELSVLGLTSPQKIEADLLAGGTDDAETRGRELLDSVSAFMTDEGNEVVRLDPESCDPLLVLLLDRHADDVLARHPAGRGKGRPPRVASAARQYNKWRDEH